MCKFFSYVSKGDGEFKYFDVEARKLINAGKLLDKGGNKIEKADSHAAICSHFGINEDACNKYEYLPDEDQFVIDTQNAKKDDRQAAEQWAKALPYHLVAKLKNLGKGNSGNWNSGHSNSGNWNSGNWNSGHRNSGNWNSGHSNSGDWNSGYRNSGNSNSGNSNSGDWNSGLFNTNTPNVRLFNRNSKVPRTDPRIQKVLGIGPCLTQWVYLSEMTADEQSKYPHAQTTGGYLKKLEYKEAWRGYWEKSNQDVKDAFLGLPFFDAKIFEEITGIKVEQPKKKTV